MLPGTGKVGSDIVSGSGYIQVKRGSQTHSKALIVVG